MEKIFMWLKWLVWDSWHGESVSAFETRRALQSESPVIEIGSLRIPRWVFYLLGLLILGALILWLIFGVGKITFTSAKDIAQQPGLTLINQCTATDASGRIFYALDCMVGSVSGQVWGLLSLIVVFALGFAAGWTYRGTKNSS